MKPGARQALLDGLSDFTGPDYFRQLRRLHRELDLSGYPRLRVAILRSYTAEMMEPILKLRLILEGYNPSLFWGGYNQFAQEILDTDGPLYDFRPQVVLLMVRLEEWMPDFIQAFDTLSPGQWRERMEATADQLAGLVQTVQEKSACQVICQNMALVGSTFWGLYDSQLSHGQRSLVEHFNQRLRETFSSHSRTFIWDFERFLGRVGFDTVADSKAWYGSRNPFKQAGYIGLVDDLMPYLLSSLGRGKKCIVVDLDNTLWGGVAGEDGLAGVALGPDYPGNCFVDFQHELYRLHQRGILLAINSKNNPEDAFAILDRHPHMVLKREHFAAWRINWQDKASNLEELAEELNIGIDSLIFIDDNPAETEWVRQRHPECTVVDLPAAPYRIPSLVNRLPGLERIRLTDEDKKRGHLYQTQKARRALQKEAPDLAGFLTGLEMSLQIRPADDFSVARLAQLTQKTNQFNLTTRRYTEAQICEFCRSPDYGVFSVALSDKFGDNGIVGAVIVHFRETTCRIDTLLLSCRVIGRTVEQSLLAAVADDARQRGMEKLLGEYLPTAKNRPARDFYPSMGFRESGENQYVADLETSTFPPSPYFSRQTVDLDP